MSKKNIIFYKSKQAFQYNFTNEVTGTDGAVMLLEAVERKYKLIKNFSKAITDNHNQSYIQHDIETMVKQRVYLMMQGYEDCNDEEYLQNDKLIQEVLCGQLVSQPTLSRFENSFDKKSIYNLSEKFADRYVEGLSKDQKEVIIDVDGTDDEAHGNQQLALFNGYYGQYMYHPLVIHDGQTGALILPVLRPGNCHSNRGFVSIIKRIVEKIRTKLPEVEITVRGDCGFSLPEFYELAEKKGLKFCIGITRNERLKKYTEEAEKRIQSEYVENREKHQEFIGSFSYKAESWSKEETCYAKVESTGKGLNVRYYCSNIEGKTAQELYQNFYVLRGDASENRIKEFKNMCYADRLSCNKFTANCFRLLLSALCYEFFRLLKQLIKATGNKQASIWQVDNIRLYLLKVGASIKKKIKTITISYSKSYVCQDLFHQIVLLL